jgi:SulP family sulfate permease
MVESLLCGASAGRMTGVKLDADRELIAQGIGNIAAPFFGGIPATAAIARTSVAIKSGAKTRLCGIFHALFILASMLLLGPVMARIPLCALAGVLLVTAWRMNEWETIGYIFSHRFKSGILQFFVTMIATIVFDLTVAIIIGVIIALLLTVVKLSKLDIDIEEDGEEESNVHIRGAMIFSDTDQIDELIPELSKKKKVTLMLSGVLILDVSGAKELYELCEQLLCNSVEVEIEGESESVHRMLERAGVLKLLKEEKKAPEPATV